MLIRTFISIPVPDTPEMASLRRDISKIDGVRVSPPEQTHITLRFIGDVDDSKIKRIVRAVEESVSGIAPFRIDVRGLGAFPRNDRPNIVWMGLEPSEVLTDISERISSGLASSNIRFDTKPFKAHITVGRCREGTKMPGFFESHKDQDYCSFICREILVMKSELGPKGAKHTVLSRIPLSE